MLTNAVASALHNGKHSNGEHPNGKHAKPDPNQAQSKLNEAGDSANITALWRDPNMGNIYKYTELSTALITQPLIDFSGLAADKVASSTEAVEVLDMCCGTGVVSAHIQKALQKLGKAETEGKINLTCSDSSQAQYEYVRERIKREGWIGASAAQADIMAMPFPPNSFDFIIVAMALMLVADPYKALDECYRVTKPGGYLSVSTWIHEGWVTDTRDAVADLCLPGRAPVFWPRESDQLIHIWGPGCWDSPSFASAMLHAAGFVDIETEIVTKYTEFRGADEWCNVFRAFMMSIVERFWNREEREKLQPRLMPIMRDFFDRKYGGGPFSVERTVLLTRGRKPVM